MAHLTSAAAAAPIRRANRPDPVEIGGLVVVTTAAVVLSFSALAGLGVIVGFGAVAVFGWDLPLSPLVPLCIDAYGATATRIAVNRFYSEETRRQAMIHGIIAIAVGVLGNAIYHLIEGGVVNPGNAVWLLVVAVSIIPPLALGRSAVAGAQRHQVHERAERTEADQQVAEQARIEREAAERRAAEQARTERLSAEHLAAEEASAERAEAERQAAAELAEAERLAAMRAESERLAAAELAEAERLATERAEHERAAAAEQAEAERARAERLATAERMAADQRSAERERIQREAAEAERKEAERRTRDEARAERQARAEQAQRGDLSPAQKKTIIYAAYQDNPDIKAPAAAEAVTAQGGQMSVQRARALLAEVRQEASAELAEVRPMRSFAAV
jgi:hypothetical protein